MISEITFSRKFTSFWNQLLPNANNFIRLVNGGLITSHYEPISDTVNKNNIVLINEISFYLYSQVINQKISFKDLSDINFYSGPIFLSILDKTKNSLSRFTYGSEFHLPLSTEEIKSIVMLLLKIKNYFHSYPNIEIFPKFKGCGFIDSAYGDIYTDQRLIEIKSGERHFKVIDFRQILVYCTLNYYSDMQRQINTVELFNPRMGISFSIDLHSLCKNLASLLPEEIFSEIKFFITENDFIQSAILSNLA